MMIFDFLVLDERYHQNPDNVEVYFATNDFGEARLVANEVCFNAVVVRNDPISGEMELIYDAAFNTELALEP